MRAPGLLLLLTLSLLPLLLLLFLVVLLVLWLLFFFHSGKQRGSAIKPSQRCTKLQICLRAMWLHLGIG